MSLDFVDVHHGYGGAPVLRGVSLAAPRGAVTCLVGASGSGKTTMLRLAAGMMKLQAGEIRLDGERIADARLSPPPEARDVGLVFQEGALFPHLDVAQNIGFGLRDPARRQARVDQLLQLIGLSGHARLRPHQLSGGQQQRVALARALAPAPQVLLLDEPFASLDARTRRELRAEVREILIGQNVVSVLVTHDPEEAMETGDCIVYLEDGRIVQSGAPAEFFDAPATAEVARTFCMASIADGEIAEDRIFSPLGAWPIASLKTAHPHGPVRLAVRPDDLRIAGPSHDAAACTVIDSRRSGSGVIVTGRAPDGSRWTARGQDAGACRPGDRVSLAVAPHSVMVFPPSSSATPKLASRTPARQLEPAG